MMLSPSFAIPVTPRFINGRPMHHLPLLLWTLFAALTLLQGLPARGDTPGKAEYDRAVAEADRLDPGWRLKDIEAKRVRPPASKDSAKVLDSTKAQFSLPTDMERKALGEAFVADPVLRLDPALRQQLTSFVDRNRPILPALRGLADRPTGHFIFPYNKNFFDTQLPHAQILRDQVRLLQADALLRVDGGDPDGALASCRAAMCAARSLFDEPIIISQIVRIACDATTQRVVSIILNRGRPSDSALKLTQELISDEVDQQIALTALRGERAFMFKMFGHLADGTLTIDEASNHVEPSNRLSAAAREGLVRPGVLLASQGIMLELMTQSVEVVRRPTWTWIRGIENANRSLMARYKNRTAEEVVPMLLLPSPSPVVRGEMRTDALGRSLMLLIAAKRYAMSKGSLPTSVKALVPKYLAAVPVDPLTGKSMLLLKKGDRLIAYSAGVDGRDDGGAVAGSADVSVEKSADVGFELSWKSTR